MSTFGLMLNVVVLWNTLYMNAALDYLRESGLEVRPENFGRLSPPVNHHVNKVGQYHLFQDSQEYQSGSASG